MRYRLTDMKMDLDLNPPDFQLCDGFGFDNLVLNFFAHFSSVSEL